MKIKMHPATLLFFILLFAVATSFFTMTKYFQNNVMGHSFPGLEGFSTASSIFPQTLGDYPTTQQVGGILTGNDIYPATNMKIIGDKQEQKMWWNYPIFEVGSYKQMTNNIRYPRNPDDGKCTAAEFCNIFYENAPKGSQPSNVTSMLPVVPNDPNGTGARVNYFWTEDNLLPFRGQELFVNP